MSSNRVVDLRKQKPVERARRSVPAAPAPRRSPLRERKRRTRAILTATACVVLLACAYAVHVVSYLPQLTYQNVTVEGAATIAPQDIQTFVDEQLASSSHGFISGRNIFTYRFGTLENDLLVRFPQIKTVSVSRDSTFGNGIHISLEERTPFATWCSLAEAAVPSNDCYVVDSEGRIFASAAGMASSSLTYVFTGALSTSTSTTVPNPPLGLTYASGHFPGIVTLMQSLGTAGFPATHAALVDDQDFAVQLQNSFYIKASFGEDAEMLVKNLILVLSADALKGKTDSIEYVDLRFGNRVYYKLKGQAQAGS